MAYEHNDIATKNRLMSGLGEEIMGFEHNDIVTVDVMEKAIAAGGGGGGDFSTAKVTFVIGSGLGSFSYGASVDYPSINPNTSSQVQYAETNVIGDTASPIPRQEINSTQVVNVLTYKGTAYISTYFELYPYNDYSPISVSGYTLSGAAETVEDEESPFYEAIKVTGECTITLTRE